MDEGSWLCTGSSDQDNPQEKEYKKAKWLSKEALQIAEKRREVKGKGEKERYTHLNAEFQRISRRDQKAFLSYQCKEIEENNRLGKIRDLFKKIGDIKGTFRTKMGTIKDRKSMLLLLSRFSRVQLCATSEMAAHQAPPSLEFSRQEHWSRVPLPSPYLEGLDIIQYWGH